MADHIHQYEELAKYYDLFYESKDYAKEARTLRNLITRHKRSPGNTLLDVACGTGKHIRHLRRWFDCVGVDASEQMLEQARRNAKGIEFLQSDMTSFDLKQRFDVVLCLFGSIGYVRTSRKLAQTLRNFANHLRDGGVMLIEPWFTKSSWKVGSVHLRTISTDDLKIARIGFSGLRGTTSVLDERILVAKRASGISYYRDPQEMGLFEKDEFLRIMRAARLDARYLPADGNLFRGLYVGVREC